MLRHRLAGWLAIAVLATAPALADEPTYAGPWDPATEAAAEAAVARMGAARSLAIVPEVLRISGLEVGVAGAGSGIVATVQEVHQAMQALGATESAIEVKVDLPADVLFDFDKADVRADAADALGRLATVIRGYPTGRVNIEGHTDSKGDDAYNQRLSERRAASVKRWLVERDGIAADRLTTRGAGESRPVADNSTEAGRQKNRRVEVVIQKSR
ncbi:MAG: OmpA-OmpF porin, family [Acidobacteriota bacterium]|jgi:outer membrane protein OmpA-like peptidoglycan-associated protein|nr:OmpA-OmpF porin, family [Acidobacteriota bacterium]